MALGTKLEHAAKDMGAKATTSGEKCTAVSTLLTTNKEALDSMIVNIGQAAQMSLGRQRMFSNWKSGRGASTKSWMPS